FRSQDTHEPIRRAQVFLAGTAFATTTDSAGRFAFSDLDAGVFMIEIRAVGFAPGTWRAPLKPHQVLTHHFELERLPYELPEVVRSEEHTSELQSRFDLVCRLLLEKKKKKNKKTKQSKKKKTKKTKKKKNKRKNQEKI